MPFPVNIPYSFGTQEGIIPVSELDVNYQVLATALNGVNDGSYPLTGVSVTGGTWAGGTIAVAYGGTGVTSSTGSGSNVLSTSPTLVTPVLGTPTSVTLTNATGLPVGGISATGTASSTTYLRGDGSWATVSSGVTINTTTITGGTTGRVLYDNAGTVGELATTGSGNVALATSPTFVTPILGTPTSVTLTNATGLPLTTGITGTLPIANGGTNITTYATGDILYASASNTLSKLAVGTNGYVLTLAAGVPTWAAGGGGSSAITINTTTITGGTTGRVLYDNAGTVGELATTGSGNVVLATSPTFVTPILGTPTSGTLTNATGLPLTTGVTGTLPTANGGTNLTTFTAANNAIYSTSASVLTAGTLPVLAGGTGATTASTALSNLGGVTTGKAIAMAIVFGG
jgi:hypothetical protein